MINKFFIIFVLIFIVACGTGGDVVQVTTVSGGKLDGLGEAELAQIAEIKEAEKKEKKDPGLASVIEKTPNYKRRAFI